MDSLGLFSESLFVLIFSSVLLLTSKNGHDIALYYLGEYTGENLSNFEIVELLLCRTEHEETFIRRFENLLSQCSQGLV